MAGFTTAMPVVDDAGLTDEQLDSVRTEKPSRAERRAARRATPRSRITWRVIAFLVLLVAVVGGALATIQWYGTSTYFVTFDEGRVAIYQGRPGGILWVDPELEERTDIAEDDVPARYVPAIRAGNEQASLDKARRFVRNIEAEIEDLEDDEPAPNRPGSTTSTTAGSTTTTRAN